MTRMSPGKLIGLRRLADADGRFKMLAVDQRPPIERLVAEGRGTDRPDPEDVAAVKRTLIEGLGGEATAILLDPQYLFPGAIPMLPHGKGLLVTLEDDSFEETPGGRLSDVIPDWSVEKIKRSGADAVKVLAWYRPDADPGVSTHQQDLVAAIGEECVRHDIPFIFELLLYPLPGEEGHTSDYVEHPGKRAEQVVESVRAFAEPRFGIDLFKLESPLPASSLRDDPDRAGEAFAELDRAAGRPWVMLSAGMDQESFELVLELAYRSGASGYLAGRAIWWGVCAACFPDWGRLGEELGTRALPYMRRLNDLTDRMARPWQQHPCFGPEGPLPPPAGEAFRKGYGAS